MLLAPSAGELQQLVQRIATRIGRSLERAGLITRDIENAYLAFDPAEQQNWSALHASATPRVCLQALELGADKNLWACRPRLSGATLAPCWSFYAGAQMAPAIYMCFIRAQA